MAPTDARTFPWLNLGVTIWAGDFDGIQETWLRWTDGAGTMLPAGNEWMEELEHRLAEQRRADDERDKARDESFQAQAERQRAERFQRERDDERRKADEEKRRADDERERAERWPSACGNSASIRGRRESDAGFVFP